jgi:hypothetical protein
VSVRRGVMDYVCFSVCLTVIVGLILYVHYRTQKDTTRRVQLAYDRATDFQRSALAEIRSIRAQEREERAQAAQERTSTMGVLSNAIAHLQQSQADQTKALNDRLDRFRVESARILEDAAADAMGHVRGDALATAGIGTRGEKAAESKGGKGTKQGG